MIALTVAAAAWGFAEAVVFIIVADVPISLIALRHGWRVGGIAAVAAALGASLGGALVWALTRHAPEQIAALYAALPAISPRMIADATRDFASHGWSAAFIGAFSGIPYKLYAHAAAIDGAGLPELLAMTPLVRLPRFLLIVAAAGTARQLLAPRIGMRALTISAIVGWLLFYSWYFMRMPS